MQGAVNFLVLDGLSIRAFYSQIEATARQAWASSNFLPATKPRTGFPHIDWILQQAKIPGATSQQPKNKSAYTKVLGRCNLKEIKSSTPKHQSKADSCCHSVSCLAFIQPSQRVEPPVTNSPLPLSRWLSSWKPLRSRSPLTPRFSSQHIRQRIDAWACCNHSHACAVDFA